jgi:hypothetical protein
MSHRKRHLFAISYYVSSCEYIDFLTARGRAVKACWGQRNSPLTGPSSSKEGPHSIFRQQQTSKRLDIKINIIATDHLCLQPCIVPTRLHVFHVSSCKLNQIPTHRVVSHCYSATFPGCTWGGGSTSDIVIILRVCIRTSTRMIDELKRIWKEAIVTQSCNLYGWTEENHEKSQSFSPVTFC